MSWIPEAIWFCPSAAEIPVVAFRLHSAEGFGTKSMRALRLPAPKTSMLRHSHSFGLGSYMILNGITGHGTKPWGIDSRLGDSCTNSTSPSGTNNVEAVFELGSLNDLLFRNLVASDSCDINAERLVGSVLLRRPINSRNETMTCPRNVKSWRSCSDWWVHGTSSVTS